jgi:hypothetical protein
VKGRKKAGETNLVSNQKADDWNVKIAKILFNARHDILALEDKRRNSEGGRRI